MRGFLVDTSVISEIAPMRSSPSPTLATWLRLQTDALYLSTITLSEIAQGTAKRRRTGASARAAALEQWFAVLAQAFGKRVLAFDVEAARTFGPLSDKAIASGHYPGFADVAIAATAGAHDLTIATRNVGRFTPLGIPVVDPATA